MCSQGKGLRKESFKALSSFIDEAREWDNDKQQNFACWLFTLFESSDNIHHLLVHPLEENLLKPILEECIKKILKNQDHIGGMACFYKQKIWWKKLSLLKLININFYSLWYSFHHISEDLYLGNIEEDTILISNLQQLNDKVECTQTRKNIDDEINYYRELLNDWITFKKNKKGLC